MVSESLLDNSFDDRKSDSHSPRTYSDVFYSKFPYYLSIGMTEEQYWDGDCTLTRYYRKADDLRTERVNREMWLQGMYIYDAVSRLSPILRSFAKKGTKAEPYPNEPYPLNQKSTEEVKEKKAKSSMDKGKRYMEMLKAKSEKYYKERK